MHKKSLFTLLFVLFFSLTCAVIPKHSVQALSGRALISEVKLGGGSDPKEFVEIYNDSSMPLNLQNMTLEYAKVGFPAYHCGDVSWKAVASPSSQVTAVNLTGMLSVGGVAVVPMSLNDNVAGSLRLIEKIDTNLTVHDILSWGELAPCFAQTPNPIPANGSSLQRKFLTPSQPSIDQAEGDFVTSTTPSPGQIYVLPDPIPQIPTTYPVVMITELLPDPGSPKVDSDDEYIELYNPNDFIVHLDGYNLFTASSSSPGIQSRGLNSFVLQPHEYKALYARDTGLGLVNSSSGQAWLTAPDDTRLAETPWYPANIGEDTAWAFIGNTWQKTALPTPNAENQLPAPAISTDVSTPVAAEVDPEACPVGKYRNPETNRCKTIAADTSTPTPCKDNQVRNPATNRCRAVATQKQVVNCSQGQERNPETNRCRKTATDDTKLAACQPGYERNAETNRCRKASDVKAASTTTPSGGSQNKAAVDLLLVLGVSLLVAGYAAYEYRHDVKNTFTKLSQHFKRSVE